jgi:hypothetical protein
MAAYSAVARRRVEMRQHASQLELFFHQPAIASDITMTRDHERVWHSMGKSANFHTPAKVIFRPERRPPYGAGSSPAFQEHHQ